MNKWQMVKDTWMLRGGDLNNLANGALTTLLVAYVVGQTWNHVRWFSILMISFYILAMFTKEKYGS